jgi:hypothetical protein
MGKQESREIFNEYQTNVGLHELNSIIERFENVIEARLESFLVEKFGFVEFGGEYLNESQAAQYLGVSVGVLKAYRRAGLIAYYSFPTRDKDGTSQKQTRYARKDLDAFAAKYRIEGGKVQELEGTAF